MINIETAKIIIAGIIAGLFSHWVLRVEKQIIPIYKGCGVDSKFIPALKTLIDLFVGLLMILVIFLMID
jgi:hypothetical protein